MDQRVCIVHYLCACVFVMLCSVTNSSRNMPYLTGDDSRDMPYLPGDDSRGRDHRKDLDNDDVVRSRGHSLSGDTHMTSPSSRSFRV